MASPIQHIFINDCFDRVYFTSILFPSEKIAVSFPADPNGRMLSSAMSRGRFAKLLLDAEEGGTPIDSLKWRYFEVSPYPERLLIIRYEVLVEKRLFSRESKWHEEYASNGDRLRLDDLARSAGLPTLEEYYHEIQSERETTKSFEVAAHEMVSSWTRLHRPTDELLTQLKSDLETKHEQVKFYKHGWHYIVDLDGEAKYYRSPNAEVMLRSFIIHAEDALKSGKRIQFAYCLPEYMPEGIVWEPSIELH